ncbi:MAG TPA: hypothetical protein PLD79_07700 [Halothiobacillus sp.]|nr:hypothetical protein [Halothiobacillus sp.]
MSDSKKLIDQKYIDYANDKFTAAFDRACAADAAFAEAKDKLAAAQFASTEAIAGRGKVSPMQAEDDLEAAIKVHRVAEKTLYAAKEYQQQCADWKSKAIGAAHAPMFLEGIRQRIAAAAKIDDAKSVIAEAEAAYEAGTQLIRAAKSAGHADFGDKANTPRFDRTAEQERKFWADARIDIQNNTTEFAAYTKQFEPQ